MRLMTLCLTSFFIISCQSTPPEFPQHEVRFTSIQLGRTRVYMMPARPEDAPKYLREEPILVELFDNTVTIDVQYYMELRDYAKNMKAWAGQHCR